MKTLKTNRKIVLVIGLFATLFLATQVSQAQVKIGEDTAPAKGAVLDLNTTSSGYTGGLKLPNVSITSLTAIPTTFKESVTTTADKAELAGTIVYNTNTNVSANIFPGIYYWDGAKWVVQTTSGSGTNTDAWLTTGNKGTSSTTNFLGTTDGQALIFKVNNVHAGRIGNIITSSNSFGSEALLNASNAYSNAFGFYTLRGNTSGTYNNAFGNFALSSNTTGERNNAFGSYALNLNTTGSNNNAMGNNALVKATGNYNVGIGSDAGSNITTGSTNIAIGYNAQVPTATASNQLSIGNWIYGVSGDIGIGTTAPAQKLHVAGNGYITGYEWVGNRIAIGAVTQGTTPNAGIQLVKNSDETGGDIEMHSAKGSSTGTLYTPTINFLSPRGTYASPTNNGNGDVIGSFIFWPRADGAYDCWTTRIDATYTGNGTTLSGKLIMTASQIGGNQAWTNTSDVRLKTNITPIKYGLSEIMMLKPVNYEMKDNLGVSHVGFIAQDIKPIIPEVVVGEEGDLSKKEVLSISYAEFAPVLTKAIQEQQKIIETQQKIIEQLEIRIKTLESK